MISFDTPMQDPKYFKSEAKPYTFNVLRGHFGKVSGHHGLIMPDFIKCGASFVP